MHPLPMSPSLVLLAAKQLAQLPHLPSAAVQHISGGPSAHTAPIGAKHIEITLDALIDNFIIFGAPNCHTASAGSTDNFAIPGQLSALANFSAKLHKSLKVHLLMIMMSLTLVPLAGSQLVQPSLLPSAVMPGTFRSCCTNHGQTSQSHSRCSN